MLDSSADIAKVTFGLTSGGNGTTFDLGINQVSLVTPAAVPEPSSLILGGLGGLRALSYARRRNRAKASA